MPSSMPLIATGRILARWQRAGYAFSPLDYLRALSEHGDRKRFSDLLNLAVGEGLPEDETLAYVGLAAVADVERWRDQAIHFLLLPLLSKRLKSGGAGLLGTVEVWSAPPLNLALDESHIRTLADQCVAERELGAPQARALLELFAWVASGHGAQGATSLAQQVNVLMADPDSCVLLREALRFWNTAELVPALLARLVPAAADANCGRFMAQVRCVRRLLDDMGWQPSVVCERLAAPFAAMIAATAEPRLSGQEGIPATFIHKLVGAHHHEVCGLLGVQSTARVASWYQEVASFLEGQFSDPARAALRRAWVNDVTCAWTGGGFGRFLIAELYRTWYEAHPADCAATEQLVLLVRDARGLAMPVQTAILPLLEHHIAFRRPTEMVTRYLHTLRMLQEPLHPCYAARLLARLLHARSSGERVGTQEAALLARWELSPDRLHRAVAKTARVLGSIPDDSMSALLWEILLSPPTRWPSLRARMHRALNLAHLRNALSGEVDALRRVLWLLNAVPPAH